LALVVCHPRSRQDIMPHSPGTSVGISRSLTLHPVTERPPADIEAPKRTQFFVSGAPTAITGRLTRLTSTPGSQGTHATFPRVSIVAPAIRPSPHKMPPSPPTPSSTIYSEYFLWFQTP